MAKNKELKKLDIKEINDVSGGALYVFKRKSGEYGYYVPGCLHPFYSREIARECCKGTLAVDIHCAGEEEARTRAAEEWSRIQERRQVQSSSRGFKNLVDDSVYDGFITGNGSSDLY